MPARVVNSANRYQPRDMQMLYTSSPLGSRSALSAHFAFAPITGSSSSVPRSTILTSHATSPWSCARQSRTAFADAMCPPPPRPYMKSTRLRTSGACDDAVRRTTASTHCRRSSSDSAESSHLTPASVVSRKQNALAPCGTVQKHLALPTSILPSSLDSDSSR